mmetsp:Transcript_25686/g.33172  ORF Transcript_25686/g.33172 Transcript_25686/m.33172 type:complete len:116 (-) Transcript_25686:114-461(-)
MRYFWSKKLSSIGKSSSTKTSSYYNCPFKENTGIKSVNAWVKKHGAQTMKNQLCKLSHSKLSEEIGKMEENALGNYPYIKKIAHQQKSQFEFSPLPNLEDCKGRKYTWSVHWSEL